jgi:hypothetical protein
MGTPKKKGETLTEGAKTYISELVKKEVYEYKTLIDNKYLNKGITCEDDSIDLYNEVHFTKYEKNTVRLYNKYIQGECDINAPNKVIDIKTSWDKSTFPAIEQEAIKQVKKAGYEWQLRGYMWLYNKPFAEIAYCLVETPDNLLEWENNLTLHHVDDILPELRITKVKFNREEEKENLIEAKVIEARRYAKWYFEQIRKKFE